MLFFKCCEICEGDLLLEANDTEANIKCLLCGYSEAIPVNTHLFDVLCHDSSGSSMLQAAA